jgi:hypothetical protein
MSDIPPSRLDITSHSFSAEIPRSKPVDHILYLQLARVLLPQSSAKP